MNNCCCAELVVDEGQQIELNVESDGGIEVGVAEQFVIGGGGNYQSKTVNFTPTESAQSQTVHADVGYDALDEVEVNVAAIADDYVGSAVPRKNSANVSINGAKFTAPAGYYASDAEKTMMTGHMSVSATKGTVSNHAVAVTPKAAVDNAGYFATGDRTGTAVSVSASELVSGTKSITANGTGIDVTNYADVDVAVPSATLGTKTITQNGTYDAEDDSLDGYSEVTVNVSGGGGTPAVAVQTEQLQGGGDHVIITGADLSNDTVTAATLLSGYTAHDASGQAITGTASGGGVVTGTFTPATNTNGYTLDVGIDCTYFVIYLLSRNGASATTKSFLASVCDFSGDVTATNRVTAATNNSGSAITGSASAAYTWWSKSGTTLTCRTGTSGADYPGWFYGGSTYKWFAI